MRKLLALLLAVVAVGIFLFHDPTYYDYETIDEFESDTVFIPDLLMHPDSILAE